MATIINNLLPFRDYDEHEVINLFALNTTGVAGLLVTPTVANPDSGDGYSATAGVGVATYPNTFSNRYESKWKLGLSASGDTKYDILGLMLKDTREVDENGEKLIFHPDLQTKLNCVISGQNVPVLKRGLVTLTSAAYSGTPDIGMVGVPTSNGRILAIDPATVTGAANGYSQSQIVGKFMTSTGSHFGGYAMFLLDL